MKFRLTGTLRYEFRFISRVRIDEEIEAEDEDAAIEIACDRHVPMEDGEMHDCDPDLKVVPLDDADAMGAYDAVANHQMMPKLGRAVAPTLFEVTHG